MNYCPQCRSPLDPGARFCVNCGFTLPAQAPAPTGPRPFAGQPAPYGTPPPAQGYGPPAGAPPSPYGAPPGAPPGYGAPGGYGAPPPGVPPGMPPGVPIAGTPPAEEGSGMKVLGGCGIAGCIGVVLAALMCVGLIAVLIIAGGSSSSTSSGGGGPSGGGSGEVPSNGSVRDLVRAKVGPYSLVGTSPLEKVPPGVIDSVGAVYSAPDGTRVFHILLVYSSESTAKDRIENVWRTSISDAKPGEKVGRGNVTDSNGNVHGTIVSCTNVNPESFYWNNKKLVVIVSAPPPHGKGFESNAPY